jgi:hypothetical protein
MVHIVLLLTYGNIVALRKCIRSTLLPREIDISPRKWRSVRPREMVHEAQRASSGGPTKISLNILFVQKEKQRNTRLSSLDLLTALGLVSGLLLALLGVDHGTGRETPVESDLAV